MLRNILRWLSCWEVFPILFIHPGLRVVQEFTPTCRKLRCDICGKYYAMSDIHESVLPWDAEFENIYADLLGYGRTIK